MSKQGKMFRKLIAIIAVSCMMLPSFLHNSSIIANTQELEAQANELVEEENLENGQDEPAGNSENTQDEPRDDNGSVEDEVIPEDEVIKEDSTGENNQNPGIDGVVQETPTLLNNALISKVGSTFQVETNGVKVIYKVLTDATADNPGTVRVGDTTYNGNGILNAVTPTDNTLIIPETVENGGVTYSVTELGPSSLRGITIEHLTLPTSLRSIGMYALDSITAHTIIIPEGVTHIDDHCFGGNKNLRVLKLPSTLETLGSAILGNSGPEDFQISVYYPYTNTITMKSAQSYTNPPFYGANPQSSKNQTLIIAENVEQYNKMQNDWSVLVTSSAKSCLTYPMQLEFYDKDGVPIDVDEEVTKLYIQDIFWESQDDSSWNNNDPSLVDIGAGKALINDLPTLPDENSLGYKANYWGMTEMGFVTIDKDGKVESSTTQSGNFGTSTGLFNVMSPKMFAVEDKLIISVTTIADKVYDGRSSLQLSFNRNVGNYLRDVKKLGLDFYIGLHAASVTSNYKTPAFNSNTLEVKLINVKDSGDYKLQYFLMDTRISSTSYLWYKETTSAPFSIKIAEAQININPQVDNEITWSNQAKLPEITPTEGDTLGTYTWDMGQTPQLGTNFYNYTFVPDNLVGKRYVALSTNPLYANNYTEDSKTGTIEITYRNAVNYTVTFVDKDDKTIEEKEVKEGNDVTAPTAPDVLGYTFDGWDKPLENIKENVTIKALYKANKYSVKFDGNKGTDGADITTEYETPIGNLSVSVRDGYKFIGWFTEKEGGTKVTESTLMPLDGATYFAHWEKAGSTGGSGGSSSDKEEEKEDDKDNSGNLTVDIEKDTPSDVPVSKEDIKDAVLSEEEIKELASGTDINIKVVITRIPEATEEIVTNALEGRSEGAYFDISIFKKIGDQPEVKVNSLNRSMRFVIDVPEELYATEGVTRVFEVMKIHDGQVSYLPDLDQNENTVTIETDQFSTFVLFYTDSSTNVPKPNIPDTSNPTNTAALISIAVIAFIIIVLSTIQLREQRRY